MAGITAFREAFVTSGMEGFQGDIFGQVDDFESADARILRYQMLWAFYQGNAFRHIHKWARKMKSDYGLYSYIRDIYNPANRICNFHQTHVWGGHLDREAGDGSEIPTALPIEDADEGVTEALSQIWKWSKWHVRKDIITLYGAIFGDVFVRVLDLPDLEMVYLDRVHPGWVIDSRTNVVGELTYYEMQYMRLDPEKNDGTRVEYNEKAFLEDNGVRYQTLRQGRPYAWDGNPEEWTLPYPFIPMVHIKHNDVGIDWGWSELFPNLSKFRELDDQGSKLSDQIRKMVDSPWMFSGIKPSKSGGTITIEGVGSRNEGAGTNPEISREETPILYAHDPAAKPYPLIAPLDIEAALSVVKEIAFEVERAYPELRTSMWRGRGQGDVSGRALLIARQEAEDKVEQRRTNYDEKLVEVHKMAIAIAGDAGYEGFKNFSMDALGSDFAFHRIKARRPVFRPHPSEVLDQERALWTNATLALRSGVALDIFLQDKEWEEERIAEVIASEVYQAHLKRIIAEGEAAEAAVEEAEQENEIDQAIDAKEGKGDTSGRGADNSADFDVATRQKVEG